MLRHERWDTDAQVYVEAVVDFPGGAARDPMSPVLGCGGSGSCWVGVGGLLLLALRKLDDLDVLGLGGLNDAIDVNARDVDRVRLKASDGAIIDVIRSVSIDT